MNEDRKNEELRVLYAACVSEISSFKKQQWQVTNYALVLDAALVSIGALFDGLTGLEYGFLLLGAFIILSVGWYLIGVLDSSIQVRRSRLSEIRKHFTEDFMNSWRYGKDESEAPDNPDQKLTLRWLFRYVLSLAFLVSCWLLIRYAYAA